MIERLTTEELLQELLKREVLKQFPTSSLVIEICNRDDVHEDQYLDILSEVKKSILLEILHDRQLDDSELKEIADNCCNDNCAVVSNVNEAIGYIVKNDSHLTKDHLVQIADLIEFNDLPIFDTLPKKMAFNFFLKSLETENPFNLIKKLEQ